MEILIVLFLIILNGVFAMAEIAIVSSRKSKLQQLANEGNKNALAALELAKSPNRFLSTVQIGITLIGIFAGAFGGATIAENLATQFSQVPQVAPFSDALALTIVVSIITYLSLIIGELAPKRFALTHPERIATIMARPMNFISKISAPVVTLLSFSTDMILRLFRVKPNMEPSVSDEEIRMMLREGTQVGVFEVAEKDIVERTLRLGDKKIPALMTSRKEITWLDIDSSFKSIRTKIIRSSHAYFPVCRDNLDKVIGVIRSEDMLRNFLVDEKIDLKKFLLKPLFIPESMDGLTVLELFKKSGVHMALVIDEFGNVQGLLSLNDILEAIVGDIPTINELEEEEIIKRDDGSWLVDGLLSIDEFKEYFHIKKLPDERSGVFHTIGGFVMHHLGRIPVSSDTFEREDFILEVVDMDGNRVDKVLIKKKEKKLLA
ncbi:MAG: HlyC/CorC family transporter [Candidatus Levybacteria bacterium]|nr:HlyC/CorC family transporter [Candidatus Levybacteria bacterium]